MLLSEPVIGASLWLLALVFLHEQVYGVVIADTTNGRFLLKALSVNLRDRPDKLKKRSSFNPLPSNSHFETARYTLILYSERYKYVD